MSECISSHGEYSEHEPSDEPFICGRCYVFDQKTAIAEINRLRAAEQRVRELADDRYWRSAREILAALDGKPWDFTISGEDDAPDDQPAETEVVDLAAALLASVNAAKKRREAAALDGKPRLCEHGDLGPHVPKAYLGCALDGKP